MRFYILLFALLAFGTKSIAQNDQINWITMNEALAAQKKEPKKIMIDMYTNWCGPCKLLDKNTFQNKDVADYVNKHYYAVKFNAEGKEAVTYKDKNYGNPKYIEGKTGRNNQHELAVHFGITAYPTVLFLDEEAKPISPVKGYHQPKGFEVYLKVFATDDYKKITTQEQFQKYIKEFKHEFKVE
ncbi:MAG: thioredoxin family protein [Flavobacteriales bacterium]|nr:MAG: thioredoxin family protein [Flavobacteriales bacterium]